MRKTNHMIERARAGTDLTTTAYDVGFELCDFVEDPRHDRETVLSIAAAAALLGRRGAETDAGYWAGYATAIRDVLDGFGRGYDELLRKMDAFDYLKANQFSRVIFLLFKEEENVYQEKLLAQFGDKVLPVLEELFEHGLIERFKTNNGLFYMLTIHGERIAPKVLYSDQESSVRSL